MKITNPEFVDIQAQLDSFLKIFPEHTDDVKGLCAFIDRLADKKFIIANAGPMNPGKSTLFNALLEKEEAFKTADRRETVKNSEIEWKDNIVLLDTPGCDSANIADDAEAMQGIRRSDIVLFVHNVNTGGLVNSELALLKAIQNIYGADFSSRVFMVCTRTDEVEDETDIDRNCEEIVSQLKENMSIELKLIKVSPKYYLEGIKYKQNGEYDDAQVLIASSGVPKLIQELMNIKKSLGRRGLDGIKNIRSRMIKTHVSHRKALEANLSKRKQKIDNSREDWQVTLSNIKPEWEKCGGGINSPINTIVGGAIVGGLLGSLFSDSSSLFSGQDK